MIKGRNFMIRGIVGFISFVAIKKSSWTAYFGFKVQTCRKVSAIED